jgi:hypothetical protein
MIHAELSWVLINMNLTNAAFMILINQDLIIICRLDSSAMSAAAFSADLSSSVGPPCISWEVVQRLN